MAAVTAVVLSAPPAAADTQPDPGTPTTVSADALPTVQQNGVVWAEVTVGNTVYATGSFSQTYPAGAAKTSANATARTNLLAFDITTGNLTSFNHSLNAQGLGITASPDGSRVYVVGDFTSVDGQTHNHIAAFDTASGTLVSGFTANIAAKTSAVTATNTAVYAGGNFFSANGVARQRLAAFQASNGALLSWAPTADDNMVNAMVLTPDQSRVIIGGKFSTINQTPTYGLGSVSAIDGSVQPFAINQTVQDYGDKCGILSLSTDGTNIFGSGFAFGCGNFEGVFQANPTTGNPVTISDCHGDTYDTFPVGQIVYSVSHAHDCSAIGDFPDTTNPRVWHHSMAQTIAATTTNIGPDDYGWNFNGQPAPSNLDWYPAFGIGSITGQYQSAWAITGNSKYLALGGEFPSVDGNSNQTGLVRFAVPSIAPNKVGPLYSATSLTPSVVSLSSGTARVAWQSTWDYDNENLTYKVFRDGSTTPIYTTTSKSRFWKLPSMGFIDTGLTPGSTHKYQVKVYDPYNNTTNGSSTSVTITSATPSQYASDVLGDGAANYWRLGESSGTTGYDWAGYSDLTEASTVGHGAAGAIIGDSDGASTFDGTSTGSAATTSAVPGPNTFSIETWINTTTTSGGKIVGFGDQGVSATSGSYDRHIYMDNAGHIIYGVYNNGVYTVSTNSTYNDGQWHQIVATLSGNGMVLYIDGKKVGTNQSTTVGQAYNGYWRIGGDNLGGWPSQPASNFFSGTIDDVAIYPSALNLSQVQKHFVDSGRTLNIPAPPTDSYGKAVYADNPDLYWRLDDASGPTAKDASPNGADGVYFGTIGYRTPSSVTGPNGTGVTLDGSTSQISSANPVSNPTVYSEELWFNTTTTSGGKLIGLGDQQSGMSGNYDRHIWMLNSGQLVFGTYTGQTNTIVSQAAYNDGKWHHVVATQGPAGMVLYLDGVAVGTNSQTAAQNFTGYWKVGGDPTWGGNNSNYFAGVVDEVAVYSSALSAAQVAAHYKASPAAVNVPPTAAVTRSCSGLTCTFDGSGSNDVDGTVVSYAWNFGDGGTGTGVTATHTYASAGTETASLVVTDDGGATGTATTTLDPKPAPADAYGQSVLSDNPALYWRLDEAAGPTAADASINDANGTYTGGVTYQAPSTVTGPNGTGVTLNGVDGLVTSQQSVNNPTVFSEELWFNTTTTSGGRLIGFSDQPTGSSSNYDRHVWMLDTGQLEFGTWTGQANTITSSGSYNDGKWHQVVATIGPNGMVLYVDGQPVGTNPNTGAQAYTGYWRVGGDHAWGGNSSEYFAGEIDEVAVYSSVLSAARVQAHYTVGTSTNIPPTAAFTPSCTNLACSFDGTASNDPDGTIAGYAWNFGDSSTGTGSTPNHTYAAAGTYNVTLTVTDNKGATGTTSHQVTVTTPPNQPPTASFTSSCTNMACSFDGSKSSDPDGTVASYAWNFGDGATGTGVTANHTYTTAGNHQVTLTVTDNLGATGTSTQTVTTTVPPNQPPVAAFTPTCTNLACSFDGSASTDPDGTVASYAWSFGDGTTGTGVTATDTYQAAGDYTVTLTVTDNQGATNSVSHTVSPRPAANPPSTPYATDSFNRTVTSGWGTADTGGAWAGSTTSLSVAAGVGSIRMATAGAGPSVYLNTLSTTDTDTTATLTTDKVGTGNGVYLGVVGRRVTSAIDYRARLRVLSNNTVAVSLLSENAGVEKVLKGETVMAGLTYTPGTKLKVRVQVTGTNPTTLRVKAWAATATEPAAWLLSTTDTTAALQVKGSVGFVTYLSSSATNSPVVASISAFATAPTVAPPTAAFTANCTGLACSVDGSGSTDPSGTISSYTWSWGDGVITTGQTSSHTFAAAGTYRITLTVTDPSGWTDVTTRTVTLPA